MRILCTLLIATFCVTAQAQNLKQFINAGDERYAAMDFYGAYLEYDKAIRIDSVDIHLLYKYAESLRQYDNYEKAAYYYAKIYKKDRGKIYPEGIYWLSHMQKYNQDYRNAIKGWKKVNSIHKRDKKSYKYLKSKQEIVSCSYAMRARLDTVEGVTATNLGEGVNTTNWEFSAVVGGGKMLFSSLRAEYGPGLVVLEEADYRVKIYEAENKGTWQTSGQLDSPVNDKAFNTGSGSFSADGKRFYFINCDDSFHCEVYVSVIKNGKWGKGKKLTGGINRDGYGATQPMLASHNGKEYLFFASNRPGGQGKLDIWAAPMTGNSSTGTPFNLGPNINTADNDVTPFFDGENEILYFSSTWHRGLGGFDVFQSKGNPEGWAKPTNMSQPINTSWNDFYYYPVDKHTAYMTSNRKGSYFLKAPTCCNDIYEIKFPVEDSVTEPVIETLDDLNKYLPVTLYFHNDCPNPRTVDTVTNLNYMTTYGDYTKLVPKYKGEYSEGLLDEKAAEAELDIEDFFKDFVDKGVSDLALFTGLLLGELRKGQNIELTIKGFASPLAKTDYNVKLTGRRISSLQNYLREYNNGEFLPYLTGTAENGGTLSFVRIPFGEYVANNLVSDNLQDQRNSVYSRAAALERKIEVQTVRQAKRDSLYSEMTPKQEVYDFGQLKQGDIVEHVFEITNTGNIDLMIERVVAKCGCNVVDFPKGAIKPGEVAKIKVTFDTAGLQGKIVKSVTVVANSFPPSKRLVVTAEVNVP